MLMPLIPFSPVLQVDLTSPDEKGAAAPDHEAGR